MTIILSKWTEADSDALDAWIVADRKAREAAIRAALSTGEWSRENARPDNCLHCGVPLRSSRTPVAKAPGTLIHAGRGHCNTCRLNKRGAYADCTPAIPKLIATPWED